MTHPQPATGLRRLSLLSLGALGVVYGDIGTSPIYALRECLAHGVDPTPDNVLGVLSLIFWTLMVLITVEYQMFVLRADNRGEGGILALLALLRPQRHRGGGWLQKAAILGAALVLCDGVLTPAISVLSAVEGLEVAAPALAPAVLPITVGILLALFRIQRGGTARIGVWFGPITALWFVVMAVLGTAQIVKHPGVLAAINPVYGATFLIHEGWAAIRILGSVFLVVTGAEALYADLGHFGRRPIVYAWFGLVFPALLLCYFGQGALILNSPTPVTQPFFELAPDWALYPLIALATAATVIASQAVISGAFSLTRQAIQMGVIPRVKVVQTSAETGGQIYIPALNTLLMLVTLIVVLAAGSSGALANAYGVAISTTMIITTGMLFLAMRWRWHVPLVGAVLVCGLFLAVDVSFFSANMLRVPAGGWMVLAAAAVLYGMMRTWNWGRSNLIGMLRTETLPLPTLFSRLARERIARVPGTAVFMTAPKLGAPPALQHHLRHAHALHERVILLTVENRDLPRVAPDERLAIEPLEQGFYRLFVRYGFAESPDLPHAMEAAAAQGLPVDPTDMTYFIGRETLIVPPDMRWFDRQRERLYVFMFRNALRATDFYRIPPRQAVEIGLWVEAAVPVRARDAAGA
ncbi:MAG: potassium transporter Kup [Immundisolibacter sp.]|uniref:potassium transporter Kup n=1 Tax=Immundisolibacter sp. TaxID=1934948 RepID=UPI003D10992C